MYLKLEGINYKGLWDKFFGNGEATVVKEPILNEFIKNLNLQHPKHKQESVHLEIFIKHDDHVIYCDYVNETSLEKIVASEFFQNFSFTSQYYITTCNQYLQLQVKCRKGT